MARYCIGAFVLLTALLCITWCDALSCRPCDKSRCKPLTRRDCPNGIGKDVCGCCDRCLKGEGEECGGLWNLKGSCGKRFTCSGSTRNKPGVCVKKLSPGKCPEGIACIALYRPPPKNCKFGYSKPACGCFAACNRCAGQSCGYKTSRCQSGYYCKGQRYIKKGNKFEYISGICTKKASTGRCPYRIRCNRKRCPRLRCRYGSAKALCACCPSCLKGSGGTCGLKDGVCRKRFYCRGASVKVVGGWPKFKAGRCVIRGGSGSCYKKQDCRVVRCARPPRNCKYGVGKSPCGCCQRCLKGPKQSCGVRHSSYLPCGKGLKCVGERASGRYRPGRCVGPKPPNGSCPFRIRCPVYIRAPDPPTGCRYGYSKPICGCEAKCNKGGNQSCGYRIGNCRSGYYCRGQRVYKDKNGKICYRQGKCVRRGAPTGSCPCRRPCPRILCRTPRNCKFGYSKSKCGCCAECRKGNGERCGARAGDCRYGFYCQGTRLSKDSRGNCRFKSGICRPKRTPAGRCPRPVPCTKIYRPPPTGCRYGYSQITCGCGKACNKGSGERCGYKIGNCRSGYSCRGQRYVWKGDDIKYIDGRCYKKGNTTPPKCYRKLNCAVVSCAVPPTNCKYGVGTSPCGCCPQCLKGPGEKCGKAHSSYLPCGKGLQCYGERFTRYYRPGQCFAPNVPERICSCPRRFCKCKDPHCKFGSSVPRCGCCKTCRKDLNQKCGDGIAYCRNGLYCAYKNRKPSKDKKGKCYLRVGRCERRIGSCPYPLACPQYLVAPRPPTGCRYGYSKPRCGCKAKCDKDINDKCGYKTGNCRVGFYCSGQRVRKVSGTVKYTPGNCRKIGGCSWYLNCRNRRCPDVGSCKYGSSTPRCGCCRICKRGLNGRCGYNVADCRKGYYCRNQRVKVVNGKPVFTHGKCVKYGTRFCPYKYTCSKRRRRCGHCKYGSTKQICGCDRVCNKDINEKCGYRKGLCRKGHYCRGMRVRKVSGVLKYTSGRCRKRGGCSWFLDCRGCKCPKIKCRYGSTKPRCSCCRKCRAGQFEKCGHAAGSCRKGMYCRGQKVKEVDGKPIFTAGKCIKYGGCPYAIRCKRVRCPKYKCKYGIAKPRCGCCPVCRKGANGKCGIRAGLCRAGYFCRGAKVKEIDGRPHFTPGRCKSRRNGKCPCLFACPRIRCRKPKGCRWGYEKAACGCCPACRKGPGEICGDRVGVCRRGYYCKGKRTWIPNNSRRCKYVTGVCTRRRVSRCRYPVICPLIYKPPPVGCKYGYSKPACACFNVCRVGKFNKCGYNIADCANGLKCYGRTVTKVDGRVRYTAGICRVKRVCPYRIICNKRACPRYRCRYGIEKPLCGCCPVCKRGRNGRCGIQAGLCRRAFKCVGDSVKVVNGRPLFTAGKCRPTRGDRCPYIIDCTFKTACPKYRCRWGISNPKCSCCARCRRGANSKCGIKDGDCRKGYRCVGSRVRVVNGKPVFTPGRCRKQRRSRCPYKINCYFKRACPKYRCRYGLGHPRCACCPSCLRGQGGKCGIRDGICRRGYRCVGSRVRVVNGRPRFTAGRCTNRVFGICKFPIICPAVVLPPPSNCRFGYSKPACACFAKCRRDDNEKCGYNLADCRKGCYCAGRRVKVVDGRAVYIDGVCRSRRRPWPPRPPVYPPRPPVRPPRPPVRPPRPPVRPPRPPVRPPHPPVRPPRPPVYPPSPPVWPPSPPVWPPSPPAWPPSPPAWPPSPPIWPPSKPVWPPVQPPRPPIQPPRPPVEPPRPPVYPPRPAVCPPKRPVWSSPPRPVRPPVSRPRPFPYRPFKPISFPSYRPRFPAYHQKPRPSHYKPFGFNSQHFFNQGPSHHIRYRPRPYRPYKPKPYFPRPQIRPYTKPYRPYNPFRPAPRCYKRAGQSCGGRYNRYGCCRRGLYCRRTCATGRGVCVCSNRRY